MTRVLHLIDQGASVGPAPVLRLTADFARFESAPEDQHAWLLLGGQPIHDSALAAGIEPNRMRILPLPRGFRRLVPGADRALREVLLSADRLMCWTPFAMQVAAEVGCDRAEPRFGQATLCAYAHQLIDRAAPEAFDAVEVSRAELRDQWGATERTRVIALLADQPEQVDVQRALLAAAFTHEALTAHEGWKIDVQLICHPRTAGLRSATELCSLMHVPQIIQQDARTIEPWSVLYGCDLAVAPDPLHAGLSILWAHAAGLPVIASPQPRLPHMVELDRLTIAQTDQAKHLAHLLTQWITAREQPAAVGGV